VRNIHPKDLLFHELVQEAAASVTNNGKLPIWIFEKRNGTQVLAHVVVRNGPNSSEIPKSGEKSGRVLEEIAAAVTARSVIVNDTVEGGAEALNVTMTQKAVRKGHDMVAEDTATLSITLQYHGRARYDTNTRMPSTSAANLKTVVS
jgi:hypothetical protein